MFLEDSIFYIQLIDKFEVILIKIYLDGGNWQDDSKINWKGKYGQKPEICPIGIKICDKAEVIEYGAAQEKTNISMEQDSSQHVVKDTY